MSEECNGQCSSCTSKCDSPIENKIDEVMAKIKNKIFVLSGKGGVGKSTVSASLAVSLAAAGKKVGLLDVDFHGPSQPTLFGVAHQRMSGNSQGKLLPFEVAGIKLISIGLLLENENQAVIWRGPAKIGVLQQLLEEAVWGELDYLIMDFPPGTGDEILSACQMINGEKSAVVVTTPQELSLADCRKCLDFCRQVELKVDGIVENMSGFVCPSCNNRHDLFATGGGKQLADLYKIPLLGTLPIEPSFMLKCDNGDLANYLSDSEIGREVSEIVAKLLRN